jgi:Secretion system C-terminal sorting domain
MKLFYTLFLSLFLNAALFAVTWTGGGALDNWNDPNNWNPIGVPSSGAAVSVVFNTPGALTLNLDVSSVAVGTFTVASGVILKLENLTSSTPRNIAVTSGGFSVASGGSLEFAGSGRINLSLSATGSHSIAGTLIQNSPQGTISMSSTNVSGTIRILTSNATSPVVSGNNANTFTATSVLEIQANDVLISRTFGPTWHPSALIRITGSFTGSPKFQGGADAVEYGSIEINATGVPIQLAANSSVRMGGNVNIMNDGGNCSFGNKLTVGGNLVVASAKTLNVVTEMVVKGNVMNSGTIDAVGEAIFEMSGTSPQSIDSDNMTGDLLFRVNNSSGITVSGGNVEIAHNMSLMAGIVNTTAANMLVMRDDKTVTGGSNTAHVDGPMKKKGNDDFMFPVGDAGVYAPCGIGVGGGVSDEYVAEYVASAPSDGSNFAAQALGEQLVELSTVEYWNIDAPLFSAGRTITLTHRPASQVNVPADTRVAHYTGGSWKSEGNTAMPSGAIKSGLVTSFSPFAFGGVSAAALPVALKKIAAKPNTDQTVSINWITVNEKSISHYNVETSADSKDWRLVGRVESKGDAQSDQYYSFKHESAESGLQYYRLAIHEKSGEARYSPIVSAKLDRIQRSLVYPNPVYQELFIETTGSESELAEMQIRLFDLAGHRVYAMTKSVTNGDRFTLDLSRLPAGAYTVQLIKGALVESHQIVKSE